MAALLKKIKELEVFLAARLLASSLRKGCDSVAASRLRHLLPRVGLCGRSLAGAEAGGMVRFGRREPFPSPSHARRPTPPLASWRRGWGEEVIQ
jgi:hypothetical protein